jgi:hypothetical protein
MLYSLRKRMQAMVEAEAIGQSFWTEEFSERVRGRIRHAWTRVVERTPMDAAGVFVAARRLIVEQQGTYYLYGDSFNALQDFELFLESGDDESYATALEAILAALLQGDRAFYAAEFAAAVNEIFQQERVAWKLVDFQMIEMRSEELHEVVVEPALRLIHSSRFGKVDATYRKALDELSKGDGADAVTDAGTALQELLEALGCTGNQLGDLIRSARQKGLLGAHNTPLLEAVERAMHWVAADRSQSGESHHASEATRDDAWLIVHVVGAFIVRLASGGTRPGR